MTEVHGIVLLLDRPLRTASPRTVSPRQLMQVANRPLGAHAIQALRDAGAARILVVTDGATRRVARKALAEAVRDDVEFRTAATSGIDELEALRRLSSDIAGASLVVHRGDSLVGATLGSELTRYLESGADGAALYLGTDLASAESRFENEPAPTKSAVEPLGIEFLSPALVDALAEEAQPGRSRRLCDFISHANENGWNVDERIVRYGWRLHETGDNVLDGNRIALDELVSDWHPDSLLRTRIEGRVKIHPSSRIEDALVRGPCAIGADVVVRHAYIGPYTSVGDGCRIENAELEHSLIMADATIRDLGWRLEHSLVGARAHLSRDFRVPKAVHLEVGADARISVS